GGGRGGRGVGRGGRGAGGSHWLLPRAVVLAAAGAPATGASPPPYSTLPAVSSRKASSSEASCGVSSCSTILFAVAISPIRGASRPVTLSAAACPSLCPCAMAL